MKIFIVSVVAFLLCYESFGQQRGTKSEIIEDEASFVTYGIAIGVSDYENQPRLSYADKDAENVYKFLLSLQPSKNAVNNITLFTNRNATRDAIAEKLYEIDENVKKGDKVYIYFGGHGDMEHLDQTQNCLLLLSDSPKKNYLRASNSFLDIGLFSKFFSDWNAKQVKICFICDACHSGDLSGGVKGRSNTLRSLEQAWTNEIKMLSCQANELSLEGKQWGGGRGLFSFYLIAGMQGLADKNRDSLVTVFELKRFVEDSVSVYSEQTQMPLLTGGNINNILLKYTASMYATAKKSMIKGVSVNYSDQSIAFKGNEDDAVLATLKDSVMINMFKSYQEHMRNNEFISPKENCALSVLRKFPENNQSRVATGYMKLKLLNILQKGFEDMTEYLYDDKFEQFDFGMRYEIERNIAACLQLVGNSHYMYNKLRARQLFLSACNFAWGIQTGVPITAKLVENLQNGIDSLKIAVGLDPMSPFLHLRIGDYYLFSGSYVESIAAYEKYTRLLPKDEYALNKLGFAYFQSHDYKKAAELFQKAYAINPSFYKAKENFEAARNKMK